MPETPKLNHPWLVAVWPGMGNVAISAGYYLMSKLGMQEFAELSCRELFEQEQVEVKQGLIRSCQLPRSRFFFWEDPSKQHDIVVFIGEAQPPLGKHAFCTHLIRFALQIGVERVFTFAAMATEMHPECASRVFGAAIDDPSLKEIQNNELTILQDGNIGGLNGVLLGVAAEHELSGACLLGEMPHIFAHLFYPKASLSVLQAFIKIAEIELDLQELREQAQAMDQKLGELISRVERAYEEAALTRAEEEDFSAEATEDKRFSSEDRQLIEKLFEEAKKDRTKAYELKRELDRLDAFQDYEDRFLDLFKQSED